MPTRVHGSSSSILDLHLASAKLARKLQRFRVGDTLGSDHNSTISTYELPTNRKLKPSFNRRKMDWLLYKRTCEELLAKEDLLRKVSPIVTPEQLELAETAFRKVIYEATASSTKLIASSSRTLPREIVTIIKEKRKLRRQRAKLRSNEAPVTQIEDLSRQINMLDKTIKTTLRDLEAQKQRRTIENANSVNRGSNFWNATKELLGDSKANSAKSPDIEYKGKVAKKNTEKCELLKLKLQDTMKVAYDKSDFENKIMSQFNILKSHLAPKPFAEDTTEYEHVSEKRIVELRKRIKATPDKAPGPDGIRISQIRNLPDSMVVLLVLIFRASITIGHVPKNWRKSKTVMIRKPGKRGTTAKDYRPISLTSCLCKLCEKIVKDMLVDFMAENDIIGNNQTAYQTGKSTTDNLKKLSSELASDKKNKITTAAAFLDVDSAFDAVWHEGLAVKMSLLGVPAPLVRWCFNFLQEREIQVVFGCCISEPFTPEAGVPQGSVAAPVLYIIYAAKPPTGQCNLSQYADDLSLFVSHINPRYAVKILQKGLDALSEWCSKWKIKLNSAKTTFVVFGGRDAKNFRLLLNNVELEPECQVKFLGVHFDRSLTWKKEIDELEKKMNIKLCGLRLLKSKGIREDNLIFLYKTMIQPIPLYAKNIWGTTADTNWYKIEVVERKCLRTAQSLPLKCKNEDCYRLTNIKPIRS